MPEPTLTTGGAQRAAMVLAHYDSDPRDRVARLLADLAEYCTDARLAPLPTIAVTAQQMANQRRERIAALTPAEAEPVDDDDDDPQLAELQALADRLDRCPICCRPWAFHADAEGRALCIPVVPVAAALTLMHEHAAKAAD